MVIQNCDYIGLTMSNFTDVKYKPIKIYLLHVNIITPYFLFYWLCVGEEYMDGLHYFSLM